APCTPAQRAIDRSFPTHPQLRRATRQHTCATRSWQKLLPSSPDARATR
ncbi:hypothetical protein A2U01_0108698, partial [Trifolium medium]|nr:hypothetical protein [Trifolium medium]